LALYYLETSALVKLYVREPGTDRLLQLASAGLENRLVVLAVSAIEVRSAIRRRERAGDLDSKIAALLLNHLEQHLQAVFVRQVLSDPLLDCAAEMIDRYALRAYDAIQLAGCVLLKVTSGSDIPTFVCADRQLLEAARSELIPVLNPCDSS
jgi:uncharacterized protein